MGAYGALRFSSLLSNVKGVLCFVPQAFPPSKCAVPGRPSRFVEGVPYCIVYGRKADANDKDLLLEEIYSPQQQMFEVLGTGHNAAAHLHQRNLLVPLLSTCADPATMSAQTGKLLHASGAGVRFTKEERLRQLQQENDRLSRLLVDAMVENSKLKDWMAKKA